MSSSISSSKAATHLCTIAALVILTLAAIFALSRWSAQQGLQDVAQEQLLRYQLNKVRTADLSGTVFIGDSSLGNAVQAADWQDQAGRPAVNLALDGSFGYAGSFNMLRHVLEQSRPQQVVIMHSADMMTRDVSQMGFLRSLAGLEGETQISWFERFTIDWKLYMNFDMLWGAVRAWAGEERATEQTATTVFHDDYIRQSDRPADAVWRKRLDGHKWLPNQINDLKLDFLRRTADLCKRSGTDCIYAHGPVAETLCAASPAYLDAAKAAIRATGLRFLESSPVCMPLQEIGDAYDHVRSDLKIEYSRRYQVNLSSYIRKEN